MKEPTKSTEKIPWIVMNCWWFIWMTTTWCDRHGRPHEVEEPRGLNLLIRLQKVQVLRRKTWEAWRTGSWIGQTSGHEAWLKPVSRGDLHIHIRSMPAVQKTLTLQTTKLVFWVLYPRVGVSVLCSQPWNHASHAVPFSVVQSLIQMDEFRVPPNLISSLPWNRFKSPNHG